MKSFTELYPNSKKFRPPEYKIEYKTEIIFNKYNEPKIVTDEKVKKAIFRPTKNYSNYLKEKRLKEYNDEIKLLKHRLSIEYNEIDYQRLKQLILDYYK